MAEFVELTRATNGTETGEARPGTKFLINVDGITTAEAYTIKPSDYPTAQTQIVLPDGSSRRIEESYDEVRALVNKAQENDRIFAVVTNRLAKAMERTIDMVEKEGAPRG